MIMVCRSGHLFEGPEPSGGDVPCPICGTETFTGCPGCREPLAIPAPPHLAATAVAASHLPGFCHCCGRPFPWTERVLSAVRAVIREVTALDAYERDQLRRSIDHIIHETPQTRLAILRINAMLARVGGETANSLRGLLVSVASPGVKQLLEPDGAPH